MYAGRDCNTHQHQNIADIVHDQNFPACQCHADGITQNQLHQTQEDKQRCEFADYAYGVLKQFVVLAKLLPDCGHLIPQHQHNDTDKQR